MRRILQRELVSFFGFFLFFSFLLMFFLFCFVFCFVCCFVSFLQLSNVDCAATYEKKPSSQAFDFDDIVASTTTLFDTLKENDVVVLFNDGALYFIVV